MPSEEELFALRAEKRERLLTQGDPYPAKIERTHEAAAAVDLFTQTEAAADAPEGVEAGPVSVVGRVTAQRVMGKAAFIDLTDGSGRIQLHLRRDALGEAFEALSLVDLGDFLAAHGKLFRTRTSEVTVAVAEWSVITKTLRPMPEKWHGVADTEIRYRQRYLDLMANERSREIARTCSRIVSSVRHFFEDRGFMEVVTPVLQVEAGGAAARPFTTHHNTLDMPFFLRIAPELYLKRLIVGGLTRVYDLNRSFRNEGMSIKHNPEYTMLEFYEAYSNYTDLMDLTEEMITGVAERVSGSRVITYDGKEVDFNKWTRLRVKEAIIKYFPGEIDPASLDDADAVRKLLDQVGADCDPRLPLGNLIGELFDHVAEEHLIQPTFVYDYPVEMSPLSKAKKDDPTTVERFELFVAGMEIANAYSELNDPIDQRQRFVSQLEAQARGDEEAHAMDEDYVRALGYGMPPTAGEGIGVDRLTMLLTDSKSIRDVILFPHLRPE